MKKEEFRESTCIFIIFSVCFIHFNQNPVKADSSGTTQMDLITSDPSSTSTSSQSTAAPPPIMPQQTAPPPSASTDRKKKGTLMQIQSDTISAAKAVRANIMPQKQKKKKSSQRQLVHHVFLKLAV